MVEGLGAIAIAFIFVAGLWFVGFEEGRDYQRKIDKKILWEGKAQNE